MASKTSAVVHKTCASQPRFTADVVGRFLKKTVFSPSLTLPLLLIAQYTDKRPGYESWRSGAIRTLEVLVSVGLLRWLNGWYSRRTLNNGVSDKYNWNAEIAIVTGGSDGIGQRTVLLLAARGLKIAVLDIKPLQFEAPANVKFYPCDICSREQIAKAAQAIRAELGEPTILVNNAGVLKGKSILDGTDAETRQTFEVNTLSHYWLAREFLPHMISQNHGMVVTIASLAAYVTSSNMVDYSASKVAALAFHEGLATELNTRYNARKVRTVLVTQGFTRTHLVDVISPENTWINPLLEPESVAEAAVEQILTGSSGHVIIPGSAGLLAPSIRSLPHWFQNGVRDQLERLMRPPSGN
ncbi:hypothetical protein PRK78_003363 [Emydomyces testavorans]|uniref:Short-chain dehydrogenase/reductase 3 n=1 Tax=Emydomyces testavorans TaxID=2070801 RepID=A0AAF0IIQ0_9EURO|nr:hypothetical protein PRK78_003363 [Emydomyces testavorans]